MRYTIDQDELTQCWYVYDNEYEEALPHYYDTFNDANIKMQYLNELEGVK